MSNKIAKNTIYLYIRSIITLLISLFASRVILDKLGADDFGLYNTVGSVTTTLSFLISALGLATSRFVTYDLGANDFDKLSRTFSNIFTIYIFLIIIVLFFFELIGPWFINTKLVFSLTRSYAVNVVFQISIITVLSSILATPFVSLVIAHEDMNFYAIISVTESIAKLIICYLISVTSFDKLIYYSFLILVIQILYSLSYFVYSIYSYKEVNLRLRYDKKILSSISGFAGWTLIGTFSSMLQTQGVNIITNMFFGPLVVAARAISIQVNNAVNSFISNFMIAANPQVLKRHALGNDISSDSLLRKTIIFAFILAIIICFPLFLNADYILNIWLTSVPDFTVVFVQIILLQCVFGVLENGVYTIFYSQGRVKENSLVSPIFSIIMFVIVYLMFESGASPIALSYCYLINVMVSCLFIKPFLACKLFHYKAAYFLSFDIPCFKLLILLLPVVLFHYLYVDVISFLTFVLETLFSVIYIMIISYWLILDDDMRLQLKNTINNNVIRR